MCHISVKVSTKATLCVFMKVITEKQCWISRSSALTKKGSLRPKHWRSKSRCYILVKRSWPKQHCVTMRSVLLRSHVLEIVCVTTRDQYCWDHMSWRLSVSQRVISTVEITCPGDRLWGRKQGSSMGDILNDVTCLKASMIKCGKIYLTLLNCEYISLSAE